MGLRNITAALLIIGGLNWLLVGLFQYDLVAALFGGSASALSRIIYSLVGFSAIHQLFTYPWNRRITVENQQDRFKRAA